MRLGRRHSRASRRATAPEHEAAASTLPANDSQAEETGIVADDLMDQNKAVRRTAYQQEFVAAWDLCPCHATGMLLSMCVQLFRLEHKAQMAMFLRGYPADVEAEENAAIIRVKYDVAQALAQQITASKEVRAASLSATHCFGWVRLLLHPDQHPQPLIQTGSSLSSAAELNSFACSLLPQPKKPSYGS